eukprot:gnl/TRDRNA2_/TRDRNA2_80396_c0_seq1.p1 gnl/TRDRNA2_/TRDRNA2_80396_c0~~gnl/TRDRNA2_/TRDRNA2_80396_c0_seq1.p1  ORF type:complete len:303 (+),score=33.94 gnl/TRDRNA2_/TRDRNA2_80396_c0_seq1:55-963(+)
MGAKPSGVADEPDEPVEVAKKPTYLCHCARTESCVYDGPRAGAAQSDTYAVAHGLDEVVAPGGGARQPCQHGPKDITGKDTAEYPKLVTSIAPLRSEEDTPARLSSEPKLSNGKDGAKGRGVAPLAPAEGRPPQAVPSTPAAKNELDERTGLTQEELNRLQQRRANLQSFIKDNDRSLRCRLLTSRDWCQACSFHAATGALRISQMVVENDKDVYEVAGINNIWVYGDPYVSLEVPSENDSWFLELENAEDVKAKQELRGLVFLDGCFGQRDSKLAGPQAIGQDLIKGTYYIVAVWTSSMCS